MQQEQEPQQQQQQQQQQPGDEQAPGLVINVHKDWDHLVDLITHQPTFVVYRDHIDAVMDEVLDPEPDEYVLHAELALIEQAIETHPHNDALLQTFGSFKVGLLEFKDTLHQLEGDAFVALSDQFDNYWPYD
jgi:hypothetical protein